MISPRVVCIVLFTACASVLPGCTSEGPTAAARAERQAPAEDLVRRGYQPVEQAPIESGVLTWRVHGEIVPIAWTVPVNGRVLPVVLYLPGLGESAETAGALWRPAWAHAGYAVLSVQPLDDDATAWSSEEARSLEFKSLATQRHSAARLQQRMRRLATVLEELRRRAAAGESPWQRLDFSRMGVAGYDLGAQTAMAVAGQHEPGGSVDNLTKSFRAAIVLSPVVLPGPPEPAHFDAVVGPVLSVTGPSDVDPTGLVASSARTAVFDLAPPGQKFELELAGVTHAMLSGAIETERVAPRDQRVNGRAAGSRGGRSRQRSEGDDGARDAGGASATAGDDRGKTRWQTASVGDCRAECDAAIQTVSIAFLDATIRDQPVARRWLDEQVAPWLGHLGTWRRR